MERSGSSLERAAKSSAELFAALSKLDPERSKTIDAQNPVRLIRAIEIATALGKVPKIKKTSAYDVEWIYLDFPDDVLKKRINTRLLERIKAGMLREAKKLHDCGVSYKRMNELGLECRSCAKYLQKKYKGTHILQDGAKNELIAELNNDIWHYVKRQRTWFKKFAK